MAQKELIFDREEIRNAASVHRTPFHIYSEEVIRKNCQNLKQAFQWNKDFTNYFAVKATPNFQILKIMKNECFGLDCSSLTELLLAEKLNYNNDLVMFTSNNTPISSYLKAFELGAIINLDDETHIDFLKDQLPSFPKLISFRYNPGDARTGNIIIGKPSEAKFGIPYETVFKCYEKAKSFGCQKFGAHTMVVSNCLEEIELVETARMMFQLALDIHKRLGIKLEFVNLGGGFGIPYRPEQKALDVMKIGSEIQKLYQTMIEGSGVHPLRILLECGRYVTGSAGALVTRVIHKKNTYKNYVGVDAAIVDLMRPALYGAYHHIDVIQEQPDSKALAVLPKDRRVFQETKEAMVKCDVVGCLCENNDKLAVNRELPSDLQIGDLLVIHDTGAHGHAMGHNYNGACRSAELMRRKDSQSVFSDQKEKIFEIRRRETPEDLFKTLVL